MASTTALFTGLSGLNASSRSIDVIGNNIANVNTTAYKGNRVLFSSMFTRNYHLGSAPAESSGGTNPYQVGLGVNTAGTQRNMTGGTISATGDQRDLAIDGPGFFIVNRGGSDLYTRAGAFRQNSRNDLVTISGERVRGFAVDSQFNLDQGRLVDLNIPVGTMTLAEATSTVRFSGNLDADGPLAAQGSALVLGAAAGAGFAATAAAAPPPTAPNRAETTTRLVDIEDPLLPGSGTALFASGQSLELRGAEKGNKTVRASALVINAATTLGDLESFLTAALGIDTANGVNPDGGTPGVTLNPVTGQLAVIGNTGTANDLSIDQTDLRLLSPAGTLVRYPFNAAKTAASDGESVRTTFVAYDSLGTPVEVDLTMALASRNANGTTWRYYVESGDGLTASQLTTGLIDFDGQGQPLNSLPVQVTVDRTGTGADTPLALNLEFSTSEGGVTSLSDDESEIAATYRDGSSIGTLQAFGVGADGVISGSFTNGLIRTIGQVAIATFANAEGLVDVGGNTFAAGANTGTAVVTTPGTLGAGQIVGGALELSNVDLGEEFIKLILASTGYSASSRVIRTTEELMQQLLVLGR